MLLNEDVHLDKQSEQLKRKWSKIRDVESTQMSIVWYAHTTGYCNWTNRDDWWDDVHFFSFIWWQKDADGDD